MRHRFIAMAVAWFCLATAALAQTPAAPTTLSFPALTGRVVDQAGVLNPADTASLTAELADLEASTSDQLVVVTLKSLQGHDIADYGYQLGRFWKIGQKGENSGALLIVAPAERQVRIEVGYGLEGTLTDAATKVIIENGILPAFKTGDYAAGLKSGTNEIIQLLRADAPATQTQTPAAPPPHISPVRSGGTPIWVVIVLGVGAVLLLIFCAISGGAFCQMVTQLAFLLAVSGRGGSNRGAGGGASFSGGGGSFGGGGSSGSW